MAHCPTLGTTLTALGLMAALLVVRCVRFDQAGADDAGNAAPTASADAGPPPAGTDCAIDRALGLVLCTKLAACPNLAIDHERFPDCGFRSTRDSIDLLCDCQGQACSMGVSLTCAGAATLLSNQTELGVCAQVADGTCAGAPAGKDAGSSCDPTCRTECGADVACLQLCGC